MKLIAHRGNIAGRLLEKENTPEYIDSAINLGYEVEVDVREKDGSLYLGHDTPDYEVSLEWLLERRDMLWIHVKNFKALNMLISTELRIFFHEKENQTIVNNCGIIWSHDLENYSSKSIIPLLTLEESSKASTCKQAYGICSDYVEIIKSCL